MFFKGSRHWIVHKLLTINLFQVSVPFILTFCAFFAATVLFQWFPLFCIKYSRILGNIEIDAEAYSEPCQTTKMSIFTKIVNGWKPLTIFAKSSIFDIWVEIRENMGPKFVNKCDIFYIIYVVYLFRKMLNWPKEISFASGL